MKEIHVCGVSANDHSLSLKKLDANSNDFLNVCYDFIDCRCLDVRQIDLHEVDESIPVGTLIDVWFDDEFLFKTIDDDHGNTLITKLPDGTEILGNIVLATSNDEGETCDFPNYYAYKYMDKWVNKRSFASLPPKIAREFLEEKRKCLDIGFVAL